MRNLLTLVFLAYFTINISYSSGTGMVRNPKEIEHQKYISYRLIKSKSNADFNYKFLNDINKYAYEKGNDEIKKIFDPINGNYKYYQFMAKYVGDGYNPDSQIPLKMTFHEILIIKTNSGNRIIDCFQYTLEWGEFPFTTDLYRMTAKNILLKDSLNIETLKLENLEKEKFIEGGILRLSSNHKSSKK